MPRVVYENDKNMSFDGPGKKMSRNVDEKHLKFTPEFEGICFALEPKIAPKMTPQSSKIPLSQSCDQIRELISNKKIKYNSFMLTPF